MENDVDKQEIIKEAKRSIFYGIIFGFMWFVLGSWEFFMGDNYIKMILIVLMAVAANCLAAFSVYRNIKKIKVNNS